ncbi:unnamed protein product [Lymnaea stagnalis]|uniref:Opioid growth factor receptor (OGFr) conserved domain-containing protein n=1 Tax=Lymnaea stagnalis TaxID=6523 RepID=A0AAV2HI37_LYMST
MLVGIFIFLVIFTCLVHQDAFQFIELDFCKDMNSEVQKVKDISINEPETIETNIENQPKDIFQLGSPKDIKSEAKDENSVITEKDAVVETSPAERDGQEISMTENSEAKEESPKDTFNNQDIQIRETDNKAEQSETDSKGEQSETDSKSETETALDHSVGCTLLTSGQTEIPLVEAEDKSKTGNCDSKDPSDDHEIEDVEMIDDAKQNLEECSGKESQNQEKIIEQEQLITEQVEEALVTDSNLETPLVTLHSNSKESQPSSDTSETQEEQTAEDMGQCTGKEQKKAEHSDESSDDMMTTGKCENMDVGVRSRPLSVVVCLIKYVFSLTANIWRSLFIGLNFFIKEGDNKRKKESLSEPGSVLQENESEAGEKKKRIDQRDTTARTRSGNKDADRYRPTDKDPEPYRPGSKDTENYRLGYPNLKDDPDSKANKKFYFGEIESQPDGATIDEIHKNWFGRYDLLEKHHGYIQWIFPIREEGMNWQAQPLQLHEAEAIKGDERAMERVLQSYKMMLDFYGMELVDEETGEIKRSKNYKECFQNLTNHTHNYLRITRILKSLGELGYEHLKTPFLDFILSEALKKNRLLERTLTSCKNYWIGTIKDDGDRERLYQLIDEHEYR